jgi:hypothetical protein
MFCPYGRFVSGRFVWAPFYSHPDPCQQIFTILSEGLETTLSNTSYSLVVLHWHL